MRATSSSRHRAAASLLLALGALPARAVVQQVVDVKVAKLNSDPMPDLILCDGKSTGADGVWAFAQDNTKSGVFGTPYQLPNSSGKQFLKALTADFNKDGRTDIVAITGSATSQGVKLWLQLTSNPLCAQLPCVPNYEDATPLSALPTSGAFSSIAVGDFNGDAAPDLALSLNSGLTPGVQIWAGDGNGAFTKRQTLTPATGGTAFNHALIADLNADTIPDLILARAPTGAFAGVLTATGIGNGTFNAFQSLSASPSIDSTAINHALIADLNADGKGDMILATQNEQIRIYNLNTFSGQWQEKCQGGACGGPGARIGATSTNFTAVAAADFDKDGKLDLVATSDSGTAVQVGMFPGSGSFSFPTAAQVQHSGGVYKGLVFEDFNVDSTVDILAADTTVTGATPSDNAPARTLWNHKHQLTGPAMAACVPLQGSPPTSVLPSFTFKSLTNLEATLTYRLEISTATGFAAVIATADQTQGTGTWSKPSYASGEEASVQITASLTAGQSYYWRVFTYASGRRSPSSSYGDASAASFTVDDYPPQTIASALASNGGSCGAGCTTVNLTWERIERNTNGSLEATISYRLYKSTDASAAFPSGWTQVKTIAQPASGNPSTSYDESGGASVYYYRADAVDGCGSIGM